MVEQDISIHQNTAIQNRQDIVEAADITLHENNTQTNNETDIFSNLSQQSIAGLNTCFDTMKRLIDNPCENDNEDKIKLYKQLMLWVGVLTHNVDKLRIAIDDYGADASIPMSNGVRQILSMFIVQNTQ